MRRLPRPRSRAAGHQIAHRIRCAAMNVIQRCNAKPTSPVTTRRFNRVAVNIATFRTLPATYRFPRPASPSSSANARCASTTEAASSDSTTESERPPQPDVTIGTTRQTATNNFEKVFMAGNVGRERPVNLLGKRSIRTLRQSLQKRRGYPVHPTIRTGCRYRAAAIRPSFRPRRRNRPRRCSNRRLRSNR